MKIKFPTALAWGIPEAAAARERMRAGVPSATLRAASAPHFSEGAGGDARASRALWGRIGKEAACREIPVYSCLFLDQFLALSFWLNHGDDGARPKGQRLRGKG